MLTKNDFIAAAKAFKENEPPQHMQEDWRVWSNTIEHMARAFQSMNPRFNTNMFYAACGYSSTTL